MIASHDCDFHNVTLRALHTAIFQPFIYENCILNTTSTLTLKPGIGSNREKHDEEKVGHYEC